MHTSLKQLHQHVNVDCLPTGYGGNLKMEDMVKFTSQLITEQRSKVLGLDTMEIISTRGILSTRKPTSPNIVNGDVSVQGSFRKLEID